MNSFQRLVQLHEEELYSNANTLANLLLSNPAFFQLKVEEVFATYCLSGSG